MLLIPGDFFLIKLVITLLKSPLAATFVRIMQLLFKACF